jgi:hypothetical protein
MATFGFTNIYIFLPLYTLLFALSILGAIYPEKVIAFKKSNPFLYIFVLFLATLVQFPILIHGYWEIGIAYTALGRNVLFDLSIYFLPFLYLALFLLSIYFQRRKGAKIERTSFTLAVFTSVIMCPFVYLVLMSTIYYFLR